MPKPPILLTDPGSRPCSSGESSHCADVCLTRYKFSSLFGGLSHGVRRAGSLVLVVIARAQADCFETLAGDHRYKNEGC